MCRTATRRRNSSAGFLRRVPPQGYSAGLLRGVTPQGYSAGLLRRVPPQGSFAGFLRRVPSQGSSAGFLRRVTSQGSSAGLLRRVTSRGSFAGLRARRAPQTPGAAGTSAAKATPYKVAPPRPCGLDGADSLGPSFATRRPIPAQQPQQSVSKVGHRRRPAMPARVCEQQATRASCPDA